MRILHVVSSLNVGGAERFVIDLAIAQKSTAHVEILSMGEQGEPLEQELSALNIPLVITNKVWDIRKALASVDIVHVHSSHCLLRVLLASLTSRVKVIYTRHNEVVHTGIKWRFIYQLANFRLHKMLFVADKARDNYIKTYPQYKDKAVTLLNGVKPINKMPADSHKFKLGHVGRFVPLKSQHILIEAASKLPMSIQEKISLNFFGTGDLMARNQDLAHKLIPNIEVNFFGFEADRNKIYANIDLLIVTSETEGLSLAILEAFAAEKPVIASNVGGNPELVKDDYNGYLYEYADSDTLAQHIQKVVNDPALHQLFAENCGIEYRNKYSLEICSNNHFRCYQ